MKQALDDLLNRLLEGTEVRPNQLILAILVVGLVFSLVHLLTMLVTRWGDHRASVKALVLSLLVHVTCVLGVISGPDSSTNYRVPDPEDEVPDIETQELTIVDEPDRADSSEAGNSPIWDRIADPVESEPERAEINPRDLPPIEDPTRTELEPQPEPLDVADASLNPENHFEAPRPERAPSDAPRRTNPEMPELDDPTAERREEFSANPSPSRQDPQRRGSIDDELIRRTPRTGGVPIPRPEFDTVDERVAVLDRRTNDPIVIKRGPVGSTIRQRSGPLPSPEQTDIGIPTIEKDPVKSGPGGTPSPQRFASRDDREKGDEQGVELGGPLERVRPAPRTGVGRPQRVAIDDAIARLRPSGVTTDSPPNRVVPPNFGPAGPRRLVPVAPDIRRLDPEERREIARKFGGSDESEQAVEDALKWLASVQRPAGYWDADEFGAGQVKFETAPNGEQVDRDNAGKDADAGITALALLAFFAAGHTPFDGEYATTVRTAIEWLADQQTENGYLGARARYYAQTYSHAIATFALGEALRIYQDYDAPRTDIDRLEGVVRKATAFIIARQNPVDGGWRYREYVKGQKSDTSIFGWQLMALNSADRAGIETPTSTRNLMIKFLLDRGLGDKKGLAAYRPGERPSSAMTAEAHFCKQQFGIKKDHPSSVEAIDHLERHLPDRREYNLYYWYYGTLAMFHHGGEPWEKWNAALRDLLISEQEKTGPHAGSWAPRSQWSPYGGRVYSTAMATLCLESYYRFFKKRGDLAD